MQITERQQSALLEALHSSRPVDGLTHNFYRYPARMAPELARAVIEAFTRPGDTVLDPFVGGGTTIVEALATGRRALGVDINSLATFVTEVKTTPLTSEDEHAITSWASNLDLARSMKERVELEADDYPRNLPASAQHVLAYLLRTVSSLPRPEQQRFARCCLLRLGQWAIDAQHSFAAPELIRDKLIIYVEEMIRGMRALVTSAESNGLCTPGLTQVRLVLQRSSIGLEQEPRLHALRARPTLVITSPPYPNVHVLYHRWQVAGRRETAAPYWLIGSEDGRGASYYTLGSRSRLGVDTYFRSISEVFQSVRALAAAGAPVVQLVSFSDVDTQLPAFLAAMNEAGYGEVQPLGSSRADVWRTVPNRRWYCRISAARGAAKELLLFHIPRP